MNGKSWSAEEIELLEYCYEDTATAELAQLLGRPIGTVYQAAAKRGLKKSDEFMASPAACRLRRGDEVGKQYRFKPGIVPHNKGLRRPGWAPGRMRETQFRKGHKPQTWRPVNSTRYSKDGYLQLKVTDTGYSSRDWVGVHILLWEEAHGPVPASHAVCFKDGDKENIELPNLELLSRGELMRRNTIHNLPKPLVEVIMLNGALKRKIRRKLREEQDDRSAQPSLRNA